MAVFIIIALLLFAGCVKQRMSLKEAKQVTVSMDWKSFSPPPRRIDDILAMLEQPGRFDPSIAKKLKADADSSPPHKGDNETLKAFFHHRGDAAFYLGRFKQALEDYRTALHYAESMGKTDHNLIRHLGITEKVCGNFKRAIELQKQSLSLKKHSTAYAQLLVLYANVGDLESAERVKNRGVAFSNKKLSRLKDKKPFVAALIKFQIAKMEAVLLEARGKYAEAEKYYRNNFENLSPAIKREKPIMHLMNMMHLSINLIKQGRLVESELIARQALTEALGVAKKDSEIVGTIISGLGVIYQQQGRLQDAERLMRASIRIFEQSNIPPDSYLMGQARMKLGDVLTVQCEYAEAMKEFDQARKGMQENQYFYEARFARNPLLILSLLMTHRTEEAMKIISTVYAKNKNSYGENHYATKEILGLRGLANLKALKPEQAFEDFSNAVPLLIESNSDESVDYSKNFRLKIIGEAYMDLLVQNSGSVLEKKAGINACQTAFKLADSIRGRAVLKALGKSSARAAADDPELADFVRREQDAQKYINELQTTLSNLLSAPVEQQLPTVMKTLKLKINTLSKARMALLDEIGIRFPKFNDFTEPQPATFSDIQNHLRPKEAMISIYTSGRQTHVWAIPHQGEVQFSSIPFSAQDFKKTVVHLRKALDPRPKTFGDIPEYDLSAAYKLYSRLLKPVEKGWKDSENLLVIAPGPLGQIPFSVLPTALVKFGKERRELFAEYRSIPWLIRDVSITRLPSASAFVTLRELPEGDPGRKAFAGFGDPVFNHAQLARASIEKDKSLTNRSGPGRNLSVRGIRRTESVNLDNRNVSSARLENLNRLPDTMEEILSIAGILGADPAKDVFLGKLASESKIKIMDLSNRRVIAFASHALLPGDLDGLEQPAIALSSPSVTGESEDGLLTMGEIFKLKLNADWIVLSACNTGASDGAGAEAASGLGRAFFYAGTRAILASMWPVETTSAKQITTGLFRYYKEDASLSRARAHQKSMLALIDGSGMKDRATGEIISSYAHPFFWAPFIVVGDGG
ncbi:MAG: CHAT domain-containing protein [Desulfobacterales bacterium]|nr:CHAT domain-containing protein [Desulfobacterales bacterium]